MGTGRLLPTGCSQSVNSISGIFPRRPERPRRWTRLVTETGGPNWMTLSSPDVYPHFKGNGGVDNHGTFGIFMVVSASSRKAAAIEPWWTW